jgi:hypothetical protein
VVILAQESGDISKQVFAMITQSLGKGYSGSQYKVLATSNGYKSKFLLGTPYGGVEVELSSAFTYSIIHMSRAMTGAAKDKDDLVAVILEAVRQITTGISRDNGVVNPFDTELLDLDQYRKSPNRGAAASCPKRSYTTPQGDIYFKFDLTSNEICAELFAYDIAKQLGIRVAKTRLAQAGLVLGIASYDIGAHTEGSTVDAETYSIKDFTLVIGFIEMCLFDYLIMNEDRHGGNWGTHEGAIAPLFDHNYAFGGDTEITNIEDFMEKVTSAFYIVNDNKYRHDILLLYLIKYHSEEVASFMNRLSRICRISNSLWESYFPADCERLNNILFKRIEYMQEKVGEYSARQIDDNEF